MAGDDGTNISQTPLAGVVTCCTSIEPERRAEFASMITEMGGINKLDLTSDVTHLIVGGYDTPKYKYVAKERPDVKPLLPAWLEAVRNSWMEGGETDVEALENQYRLPTFHEMKICVTGFQDLPLRKHIEQTIVGNGGQYRGDLTKEVTHLIAYSPQGAKYSHAKLWGIHVVSIEWLRQSLEREMILDETLYDLNIEPSDRGKGAWNRPSESSTLSRRRVNEDITNPVRKLRRTASAKFSSQNEALWGDIVGGGFAAKETKDNAWDEGLPLSDNFSAVKNQTSTLPEVLRSNSSSIKKPSTKKGFFYGKRFYLSGFDSVRTSILKKHLNSCDADVIADKNMLSRIHYPEAESPSPTFFLIVPYTSSVDDQCLAPDFQPPPTVVNELWVEKCLHARTFIEPESNASYRPFPRIPGFEKLTVSSTGFEDIDLLHVGKTVRRLGATYAGTLTKDISALVCHAKASPNREKILYALKWNIPVVNADWLEDSLRTRELKSVWDYLVHPERQSRDQSERGLNVEGEGLDTHNSMHMRKFTDKKEIFKGKNAQAWTKKESETRGDGEKTGIEVDSAPEKDTKKEILAGGPSLVRAGLLNETESDFRVSPAKPNGTPSARHLALRERSPNSPPKQSSTSKDLVEKDSLSSAISSLLAARQRDASAYSGIETDSNTRGGRRKRRLFGRANSNLSSRSHLSRASSVDTLNTDGVGTPVEMGPLSASTITIRDPLTEALLGDRQNRIVEVEEAPPPMTQVEYQEEEADEWRERVARRMGWKKSESDAEVAAKRPRTESRVLKDVGDPEPIGRRTRQRG